MLADSKFSAFSLSEAFHLASAISALQETGVLAYIATPQNVPQIASEFGMDFGLLHATLAYLAARTNLIAVQNGNYQTTEAYDLGTQAGLDLYVGGYGPNGAALARLLYDPSQAGNMINRARQSAAFDRLPGPGVAVLPSVLKELNANNVLDLGCGPASLLASMAQCSRDFVGWGLDASPAMCEAACRRIERENLSQQIAVFAGSCCEIDDVLPAEVRNRVRFITAASFFNEFFGEGPKGAINILSRLKRTFPGRLLVLADYYGRLGKEEEEPAPIETLLHDYIQAISGQGVPPANDSEWTAIYQKAGCALLRPFKTQAGRSFIHMVQL